MSSSSPIPQARLHEIMQQACDRTFSQTTHYNHSDTEAQNAKIINTILAALVSPSNTDSSTAPSQPQSHKYAVNSTIIQHLDDTPSASTSTSTDASTSTSEILAASTLVGGAPQQQQTQQQQQQPTKGRRGMHSATGAYWDQSTDGMFNYKWEGKGLDVVVCVMWVAV